ncbi:MAG: alpha/beta fold hydrolase [Longimicrobiales bacterium]
MRSNNLAWIFLLLITVFSQGCAREPEQPAQETTAAVDSGSVRVGSTTLTYRTEGSGPPCLVIGSHIYHPRTFSSRWRGGLRCTYLDDRVFSPGAIGEPDRGYDIPTLVSDLEVARRALGLDRFVMVGHSIFGLVALAYAQAHPEHVGHVIAIGAPPAWSEATVEAVQEHWDAVASPGRKRQDELNRSRLTADSLSRLSPGDAFVANYVASAARYWRDSTFDASTLWAGTTLNGELLGQLLDVQQSFHLDSSRANDVPVFLALGQFDFAVPPILWEGYSGPFRDVTVRVFESAGHTPQLEDAAGFDAAVFAWLKPPPAF